MQKEARKASVAWHLAASGCQRMLATKDHEGASQSFRALCNLCRAKHGLIRVCCPFAGLLAQERALTFALSTPRCPQDMACPAQYGQIADWLGLHPNEFTRNTFIHVAPKHSNLRRCQSEGPPSQFACKTPVGIRLDVGKEVGDNPSFPQARYLWGLWQAHHCSRMCGKSEPVWGSPSAQERSVSSLPAVCTSSCARDLHSLASRLYHSGSCWTWVPQNLGRQVGDGRGMFNVDAKAAKISLLV